MIFSYKDDRLIQYNRVDEIINIHVILIYFKCSGA